MSIYIKGMEMPTEEYGPMTIKVYPNGHVAEYIGDIGRVWDAVPVPPHGRLGDLDVLERMFADIEDAPYSGFDGIEPFYSADDAARIIRLAPTIIPAEEGE